MQTTKWKAPAIAVVALATSGTASLAAYVHQQAIRPRSIRQQKTVPRPAVGPDALYAPLVVSPPKYIPSTYPSTTPYNPLWLSPTQLINPEGQRVSVIDTVTGHETPLDDINAVIEEREKTNAGRHEMSFSPSFLRLSPDGRWLLWPSGTREHPTWQAMAVDGAKHREWDNSTPNRGGSSEIAWMRDSSRWIEVGERTEQGQSRDFVRVYGIDTPDVHEFPLKRVPKPLEFLPVSAQFIFTTNGHAWMVASTGGITSAQPGVIVSNVEYYELLPGPDVWTLRHTSLQMQAVRSGAASNQFELSPDGHWLVWRDNSDYANKRTRLILSRPDGSAPRTLFESTKSLSFPHWTPDEQKIVFRWDGNGPIADSPNGAGMYEISLSNLAACSGTPTGPGVNQAGSAGPFPVMAGQH